MLAFYKPPPKFKRGEVSALDGEDEPVLRDIISEGIGPKGKNKGADGKSHSEARLKESESMPEFDVGISDPSVYDHLVALWKTRQKMKKKVNTGSPDNSSVGRRARGGRRKKALEGSFSQGRKSVGDSQLEMSAGGMSGITAGETMLKAPDLNASQTMNMMNDTKPARAPKSKIQARDFLKGYSKETEEAWLRNPAAPKLLTLLGAQDYDLIPDMNQMTVVVGKHIESLKM